MTGIDYLMRTSRPVLVGHVRRLDKLARETARRPGHAPSKFEKMATGTDHDATAEQAKIKAEREAAIAPGQKGHASMPRHVEDAIAQLDGRVDTQNERGHWASRRSKNMSRRRRRRTERPSGILAFVAVCRTASMAPPARSTTEGRYIAAPGSKSRGAAVINPFRVPRREILIDCQFSAGPSRASVIDILANSKMRLNSVKRMTRIQNTS